MCQPLHQHRGDKSHKIHDLLWGVPRLTEETERQAGNYQYSADSCLPGNKDQGNLNQIEGQKRVPNKGDSEMSFEEVKFIWIKEWKSSVEVTSCTKEWRLKSTHVLRNGKKSAWLDWWIYGGKGQELRTKRTVRGVLVFYCTTNYHKLGGKFILTLLEVR